jgi:hypothetical protein
MSDYQIIDNTFKKYVGYEKHIRPTTKIKDRVEATNGAFRTVNGTSKFYVDKGCVNLIRDFDQVTWKDNGVGLDESKPQLTHPSDSVSYLFYNLHPVHIKKSVTSVR